MLNNSQWHALASYCRSKLVSLFDNSSIAVPNSQMRIELNIPHKGFYIGATTPEGTDLARSGFLKESPNIFDSAEIAIQQIFSDLKSSGVPITKLHTASYYFSLVNDVTYMKNPTDWDEGKDGIYFMWGQQFRGLYLPYQVMKMGVSKVETMDRLCAWEAGVASNLWRLPEGLVFKLSCENFVV